MAETMQMLFQGRELKPKEQKQMPLQELRNSILDAMSNVERIKAAKFLIFLAGQFDYVKEAIPEEEVERFHIALVCWKFFARFKKSVVEQYPIYQTIKEYIDHIESNLPEDEKGDIQMVFDQMLMEYETTEERMQQYMRLMDAVFHSNHLRIKFQGHESFPSDFNEIFEKAMWDTNDDEEMPFDVVMMENNQAKVTFNGEVEVIL